jgi:hypothetical protein
MHVRPHGAASAAVVLAAAALAFAPPARAIEPDALPAPLWWRAREERGLAEDPLLALRDPGALRVEAEWAPLYVSPDGSRFEQERRSLRLSTPPGTWRAAAELGMRGAVARGGTQPAWIGAERPLSASGAFALACRGERFDVAGSIGALERSAGAALAGHARLGAARATVGWSLLPQSGRTHVRWNDVEVLAEGRWFDQRVRWELELSPAPAVGIALGQDALDRRGGGTEPGPEDRIEPFLAWRASHLNVAAPACGLGWRLTAEYGEGREGVRICRSGTAYAAAVGPVFNSLVALEAAAPRRPFTLRLWTGRWSGDARAALALWPFDGLAALAGTRRLAHSSAALEHHGVSLDHTRTSGSGLEGGLALWSLAPRARYESWQATIMGVGRDDESEGETALRSALALGARLAGAIEWRGARARIELVQWVPVHTERRREPAEPPAPAGGGGAAPDGSAAGGERGGTVFRFSLETGR